ncbi:amidohydrolase [Streptomyces sp. GESEQ-35]|uniref:amidohydrolase n=1 Tax=Streptomyces sp. GESEQ-35 TaxID=2812657 RepID=UPI001B334AC1|nr:amidohydrolase [Streptomyces sp. GESEQ-35]
MAEKSFVSRRQVIVAAGLGAAAAVTAGPPAAASPPDVDLVLYNGKLTTLDEREPAAEAIAIRDDRIVAVGSEGQIRALARRDTPQINLRGRRVIPGLNDSHTHLIRQGLSYTNELSLAGARSVGEALTLIKCQAEQTPAPQWVRVAGGFTRFQFAEQRLPTFAELNQASGDTPVFLLHLYDRAMINAAGMRILGYDTNPPQLPGSVVELDTAGRPTGMLIANPNPTILYATLAKLPILDPESQVVSTRLYMRHLNRRGVTSIIDAAGGGHVFPDNYNVVRDLHAQGQLTVRIGYHLMPQQAGTELVAFQQLASLVTPGEGDAMLRMVGAGELLVFSGVDLENFVLPRPDLSATMERDLTAVLNFFRERRWPFRLHATYDESITRFLDVFEQVYGPEGPGVRFILDHAETISARNIDRVAAMGGGISVQHRMSFQGELFIERYGLAAAQDTPPVRRIAAAGVPLGLGTDATRVASDNIWNVLYWLVSGRIMGGRELYPERQRLSRVDALRHMTSGGAWLSGEDAEKGRLIAGQLADLAVLSEDYLRVDTQRIPGITSVLTMVGGRIVHAEAEHRALNPALPPVQPRHSPLVVGTNSF